MDSPTDLPNQANYSVNLIEAGGAYSSLLYETRQQADRGYKSAVTRWTNGHYPGIVEIALYREWNAEMLATTAKEPNHDQ